MVKLILRQTKKKQFLTQPQKRTYATQRRIAELPSQSRATRHRSYTTSCRRDSPHISQMALSMHLCFRSHFYILLKIHAKSLIITKITNQSPNPYPLHVVCSFLLLLYLLFCFMLPWCVVVLAYFGAGRDSANGQERVATRSRPRPSCHHTSEYTPLSFR